MSDNVLVAIIGGGTTFLTALASLLLVYKGFSSIDSRFASIERRLDIIQADIKEFFKDLTRHEADIAALKERLK